MIRYHRAQRSHCWFTNDWHLYVFPKAPCSNGFDSGVTVKHRVKHGKPERWRHVSLRLRYRRGYARVVQIDAETHLATHFKRARVLNSKRYVRFKTCL